jgi:hypothetical protein
MSCEAFLLLGEDRTIPRKWFCLIKSLRLEISSIFIRPTSIRRSMIMDMIVGTYRQVVASLQ